MPFSLSKQLKNFTTCLILQGTMLSFCNMIKGNQKRSPSDSRTEAARGFRLETGKGLNIQ